MLLAVPIALGVSAIVFAFVHLAPGDPLSAVVPSDAPVEVVEQLRKEYGYDQPVLVQYGLWLRRAASGDFGVSVATGQPVANEVFRAVGNTLLIAIPAALLGVTVGITLGSLAGARVGSAMDRVASGVAIVGISIPSYWLGLVLTIVFAVELSILPAVGMSPSGSADWAWDWQHLRHAVLPVVTLAAIPMGIVTRNVRAAVAEALLQDYVESLRARGLSRRAIGLHVAKNVAPTVLAVVGLQLGYLLGGSILIETVFSWPGTGFLLNGAIFRRDLPMLQGTILVLAFVFVTMNLLVDIMQSLVDPRIRKA